MYDHLFTYNEETQDYDVNPDSLDVVEDAMIEPAILRAEPGDRFQFVRNGYFVIDPKETTRKQLVINRTVALKSSFKPISNS